MTSLAEKLLIVMGLLKSSSSVDGTGSIYYIAVRTWLGHLLINSLHVIGEDEHIQTKVHDGNMESIGFHLSLCKLVASKIKFNLVSTYHLPRSM